MIRTIAFWTVIVVLCVRAADVIPARKAKEFTGSTQTVRGWVASSKYAANSKGRPTFLNLDKPYPEQVLTVVIWGSDRNKFPFPPETFYLEKNIRVTGLIKLRHGVPEIIVSSPSQIEIDE
ncbi:MAG: DNA-binding protein [Candidatus Omnitrophica bacterium]|nr:DNA-binding protein [Candidatus Omnitrophota bacterium]